MDEPPTVEQHIEQRRAQRDNQLKDFRKSYDDLLKAIDESIRIRAHQVPTSKSAGILIFTAGDANFKVKCSGNNRYIFTDEDFYSNRLGNSISLDDVCSEIAQAIVDAESDPPEIMESDDD